MAVELARRIHGQSITISEDQIRKWTPKVAKLMRITMYRVVKLWGSSLERWQTYLEVNRFETI
jgi:hypothetical protein